MAQKNQSSPNFVSIVWFLLGFFIFITNAFSIVFLWRAKKVRERTLNVYTHAMWNLLGIVTSFAGVGLILTITSVTRLSIDGELTKRTCDFFGFSITFLYHFAAMGMVIGLINGVYSLIKPFQYYKYSRKKSKVPIVVFFCCVLYGFINALFPLINLGDYSRKTLRTTCLLKWDDQVSTQFTGFLNITTATTGFGVLLVYFWLWHRLVKRRREMHVSVTRRKETILFVLSVSTLFLVCWTPYTIVMLVMIHSDHAQFGDKEKASIFGITLIPLVFHPFLAYFLREFFHEECKKAWESFKKVFPTKKMSFQMTNEGEKPTNSSDRESTQEYQNPAVANTQLTSQ